VTGYGNYKQVLVGVGVQILAVLLFVYRRVVQDKKPFEFRDLTESEPHPSLLAESAPAARG
jgi:hypothetical protein